MRVPSTSSSRRDSVGPQRSGASASGAPKSPAWFYNVVANPEVRVELDTETFDAVARVTDGAERAELLEQQKDHLPVFAGDATTRREFHVVVLTRTS